MHAASERMTGMSDKRLVFRIAGVGFALSLEDLVEIREAGAGVLDRSAADPEMALLGLLDYRDEAIHAINIRQKIGLPAPESFETAYVVVNGSEGVWAMPVDKVEGIFPAEEFRTLEVPLLLRINAELPYQSIQVWRSEPLVSCEPLALERFGDAA
jgi:chemotaxis signal transduction protein